MEKLKTFYERRSEDYFGMTNGEEQDLKKEVLDDIEDKINEIIDWINKNERENK